MKTKADAMKRAREVRRMMDNPRVWKVCVWQNLGWHWCLEAADGCFTLNESTTGRGFFCMMCDQDGHKHCGSFKWHLKEHFPNPNHAVEAQLEAAVTYVRMVRTHVENVVTAIRKS